MNEAENVSAQEWEKKLLRVIRRNAIQRQLKKGLPASTIKKEVRTYENELNSAGLVHSLIEEEFVIDPEKKRVALQLYKHLVNSDLARPGLSIILVGSSIHGGSMLRKYATGAQGTESDFDFGISIDANDEDSMNIDGIDNDYMHKVTQASEKFIAQNSPYEVCLHMNPTNLNIVNFSSVSQALTFLLKIANDSPRNLFNNNPALLYFEPSIPPEINQRNRELILEGLRILHDENETAWHKVVDIIIHDWNFIRGLEKKHMSMKNMPNKRTWILQIEVAEASGELMSHRMRELITSTMMGNGGVKSVGYTPSAKRKVRNRLREIREKFRKLTKHSYT